MAIFQNKFIREDGSVIGSSVIISCKYTSEVNSQTNLTVGDTTAAEVDVEIRNLAKEITAGEKLTYYQIEDGVENLIGVFYAEAPTIATKTSVRFKAYDGKAKLAVDFSEWMNNHQDDFPMSLRSVVQAACEVAGVTLASDSFQFEDLSIPAFYADGVTSRQVVSWAAQIAGCFVACNTAGEIFFDWYRNTETKIDKSEFMQDSLSKKAYKTDLINRVQFKQDTDDVGVIYPADASGNVFSVSQNGITALLDSDTVKSIAQYLYSKLKSVTYTPLSFNLVRTAKIKAGDIISITDGNGNTVITYVMKVYIDSSGTQISSTGDQNYSSTAAVSSEKYQNIPGKVLLLEKSVDGLRIENANTAGKVAKLELDVDKISLGVSEATSKAESAQASADATAKDLNDYAETVSANLTDLQNQIDGAIETWFYDYEPTVKNAPASAWTTTEEKNKHLGDLFYIVDNDDLGGQVYRWALVNGVYGWILVEDTEVAKALETASKAQDTADGKRRVFVAQPTPPYDVGDLWTDGADLRVCKTARTAGSYTASDWQLATEYIDESVAQAKADAAETNAKTYASAQIKVASDSILQEVKGTYTTKTDFSKAVVSVQEQYYRSVSSATTTGGEWSTSEPTWSEGIYVWNRRLVTYGDGSTGYEPSERGVCVTGNTGATGATGATGKGVKSTAVTYQSSTSGTTIPTGTWSTSIPSVSAGSYLWTRTIITYTDSTTSTSYSVGMMGATGAKGDTGAAGRGIKSTATTYQAGASGTTAPTGTWLTTVPATSASAPYLWTRTITTYTDGTTSTAYAIGGTIAGVEVGGRNLLLDTNGTTPRIRMNRSNGAWTVSHEEMLGVDGALIDIKETSTSWSLIYYPTKYVLLDKLQPDCNYIFSCDIWASVDLPATQLSIRVVNSTNLLTNIGYISSIQSETWTHVSAPLKTVTEFPFVGNQVLYWCAFNEICQIKICNLKLEKGNKATDWSPAPEDIDAEFDTVNDAINSAVERVTTTETKLNTIQEQTDERWAVTATKEEVETTVTKAVDSVQVGGRNLIAGTSLDQVYSSVVSSGNPYNDIWDAVTINPVTGSEYVISFEAKADEAMTIFCYFYDPSTTTSGLSSTGQSSTVTDGNCGVSIGTEWKRYWVKWTQSATSTKKHVIVGRSFSSDITAYIRAVKLEEGNKPTDWSPAPEDVDSAINEVNTKTINNTTKIESQAEQIALRATTEELNTAVSEQNSKLEAMLKVQSDAIRQEITKSVEQKIADGDDALAARYEEIRTYLDFAIDGLFLGKSGNNTIMHLINNALEILVAGVAATTVDQTGLTAAQANIKTLHMGNFTLSVSDDGNRLSLS